MVKGEAPPAWHATTGAEAATTAAKATAASTTTWTSGARGTPATGTTRTRRATHGAAALWLATDRTGHVEAPADTLRFFLIKVDGSLVNAEQLTACIARHPSWKGGFNFGGQQGKARGGIAAVVFEIAELKPEILDECRVPVRVQNEVTTLFADKRRITAAKHGNERALSRHKVECCDIGRYQ